LVVRIESELRVVEGAVTLSNLARGTQLYVPGDPSDRVFVLDQGRVKVSIVGPGGKHCVFQVLEVGEIFGESALLGERMRTASAEVIERASVVMAPRDSVLLYADRNPRFWQAFAPLFGQRIRHLEDQVQWVSLLEVEQRIARLLLRWVEELPPSNVPLAKNYIRLSQKDLAGLIGATRETTSNALNRLQRKGCIEIRRRRIAVRSVEELARHGGTLPVFKFGPLRETDTPQPAKEADERTHAARA
jgi:CRP/FNR family transcriptional regulator